MEPPSLKLSDFLFIVYLKITSAPIAQLDRVPDYESGG